MAKHATEAAPPHENTDEAAARGGGEERESGKHQTVAEVYDPLAEAGQDHLQRSNIDLALSGLIAGLDIGFGPLAMAVVAGRLHAAFHLSVAQALFFGGFLYPLGFIVVIMGKSELFTENTLAPVAGLFTHSGSIRSLARSWSLIIVFNVLGTIAFSLLIAHIDVAFASYKEIYRAMGANLTGRPFLQGVASAVLAGWLVAMIAWLIESTKGSLVHFAVIYVIAYVLVAVQLMHSIIGSIEVLLAMFAGANITWGTWFTGFLAPALIGNAIGGVVFVTGLKGFQARAGNANS
ncbi:MAG: formate/nitrite transporter family protein [Chloroflexota bacterium]